MRALLLFALAVATPSSTLAQQQLVLTADVGKTEFFEDEPIYLLLRLHNVGTDTARVYFFGFSSPALALFVRRGDGRPVEVAKGFFERRVAPSWRGEPVPPGVGFLQTMVLQYIVGDTRSIRSHLFPYHLSPDQYELRVEFNAHWRLPDTAPLALSAAPIVFRVRERTPAEENEVRELEAMRQMGWDTTRIAGSPRAAG
jgi:hypothetical protein